MKRFVLPLVICLLLICGPAQASDNIDFDAVIHEHGAILLVDCESGKIIYANQAAVSFYGYSRETLESMTLAMLTPATDQILTDALGDLVEGHRSYAMVKQLMSDGQLRTVEIYAYPTRYGDREACLTIIHDATEKVALQASGEALKTAIIAAGGAVIVLLLVLLGLVTKNKKKTEEANQRIHDTYRMMQTFLDADTNAVYLKDQELKYVVVNRAMANMYGLSSDALIGKDDYAYSDPALADLIRSSDEAVLLGKCHVQDELSWDDRLYLVNKFPVAMEDGTWGVGATVRDVTEEREVEKVRRKVSERNRILAEIYSMNFKNRHEQLNYALNRMLDLTESRYGFIYSYSEETESFALTSWTKGVLDLNQFANPGLVYSLEEAGPWGEVVRQRKPVIINNFSAAGKAPGEVQAFHTTLKNYIAVPIFADGKIVSIAGFANKNQDYDDNDVTNILILMSGVWQAVEKKETQEQLARERQKYLQTLISIGDGVMVVDKDGYVEMLNFVAQKLTGWTQEEAQGRHYKEVFGLSHEMPGHAIKDPIAEVLATNMPQELGNHAILTARDGSKRFLEDSAAPIFGEDGQRQGVVLVFRDVTEKRIQKKKIEFLSFHDELTGLFNRRYFEDSLKHMDARRNLPISILMADLNGLKLTNDVFGHASGDTLLKIVADVLREVCRPTDIIARWGGDEFVVLLPRTSRQEVEKIAENLKESISKRRVKSIRASFSIGFDCKTAPEGNLTDVLLNAEAAMYAQKSLEIGAVEEEELHAIFESFIALRDRERCHSENVRDLCGKMGQAIGLPPVQLRLLKDAAYYHDIGKAVFPPSLLEKGQPMTADEAAEVRKHPISGYRILNAFGKTLDLADIVLAHHEYWNGAGYPRGLKGDEIPLLARIIAICEHYERRLHEDFGGDRGPVIEIILSGAGTRFDPALTKKFAELAKQGIL